VRRRTRQTKKKEFALILKSNRAFSEENLTAMREQINLALNKSTIVQILKVNLDESVELLQL
jgi:hypothetical protein